MQIHLERNDLRFLAHLSMSPDWQALASMFRKELAAVDAQLRVLPPTEVARVQGVSKWLVDFLETVEHAKDQLANTRDPRASLPASGSVAHRQ